MRELPPESLLRVLYSDRPAEAPYTVSGFTRDQVLAIQKQAYEDGLRDAATYLEGVHPTRLVKFAQHIRAMLTASQKEQQ